MACKVKGDRQNFSFTGSHFIFYISASLIYSIFVFTANNHPEINILSLCTHPIHSILFQTCMLLFLLLNAKGDIMISGRLLFPHTKVNIHYMSINHHKKSIQLIYYIQILKPYSMLAFSFCVTQRKITAYRYGRIP